jgi:hypothetical protein
LEPLVTDTSVDAQAPPRQDDIVTEWTPRGLVRLVDSGAGQAAVTMLIQGFRPVVARVNYGAYAATSTVRWEHIGLDALEEYKRNAIDTKVYAQIVRWLRGPS